MCEVHPRRMARLLRVLVLAVMVVNLIMLLLVPGLAGLLYDGGPANATQAFLHLLTGEEGGLIDPAAYFLHAWIGVWSAPYSALLTLFYWVCGLSCLVILWQAKRVLDTLLAGVPFCRSNADNLTRAAAACWVISVSAVIRAACWFWAEKDLSPLFTYNTLFIPGFFMAGLLFLVMSALFRQAAEIKAENDLTI